MCPIAHSSLACRKVLDVQQSRAHADISGQSERAHCEMLARPVRMFCPLLCTSCEVVAGQTLGKIGEGNEQLRLMTVLKLRSCRWREEVQIAVVILQPHFSIPSICLIHGSHSC